MIIDLESLEGLHISLRERLKENNSIFIKYDYLEHYCNNIDILHLISDIDKYCCENLIIGYHYTNAIENDIKHKGIILRKGKDIRNEFMNRHFHLFTKTERESIIKKWSEYFGDDDVKARDNCVFFNFTKNALLNGAAKLLLTYYGGEQIYFPIYEDLKIGKKLRKIGTSMILRCTLNPNRIRTFIEYPWGRIITSSYSRTINPNSDVCDQDGYQHVGVKTNNIEILKYKKQFC